MTANRPAHSDGAPATAVRSLTRRTLLAGGAGLAAGAAATGTADRALRGPGPYGPHLASAGEELMTEHGVLKRVLLAYRSAAEALIGRAAPPIGAITDAAQIVSDYVEGFHEGLEEAYVFPRVRALQPDLVRTLLVQHDRGRHITAQILNAVADDPRTTVQRRSLAGLLSSFVRMYEPHEAWEDTVVYPALRTTTSGRTLTQLAERFRDLENARYGEHALGQIVDRVSGVEQQLGIGDLSAFTP